MSWDRYVLPKVYRSPSAVEAQQTDVQRKMRRPGQTLYSDTWSRNPEIDFERNYPTRFVNRIPKPDAYGSSGIASSDMPFMRSKYTVTKVPYEPISDAFAYNSYVMPKGEPEELMTTRQRIRVEHADPVPKSTADDKPGLHPRKSGSYYKFEDYALKQASRDAVSSWPIEDVSHAIDMYKSGIYSFETLSEFFDRPPWYLQKEVSIPSHARPVLKIHARERDFNPRKPKY